MTLIMAKSFWLGSRPGVLRRDVAHGVDVGVQVEALQMVAPRVGHSEPVNLRSQKPVSAKRLEAAA